MDVPQRSTFGLSGLGVIFACHSGTMVEGFSNDSGDGGGGGGITSASKAPHFREPSTWIPLTAPEDLECTHGQKSFRLWGTYLALEVV